MSKFLFLGFDNLLLGNIYRTTEHEEVRNSCRICRRWTAHNSGCKEPIKRSEKLLLRLSWRLLLKLICWL
ncbi:hypothetical protein MKW98_011031 [Papaver atlanticum]|uniref:Uncharacterized protein n=1 Tax=Papaver atlanticum TaxID=357466 RepID=A0AAD4XX00_9MAGN|nr:hypothetical protein MKW98_011031 [Papaver atlanticum]